MDFLLVFLLALSVGIRSADKQPVQEAVHLLELNHKYDRDGKHSFTQLICWTRHPGNGKYHVRDWVLVDSREALCGIPVLRNGMYESHFVRENVYHLVRSPLFRESWTHTDPEVEDAKTFPKHLRIPLINPNKIIKQEPEIPEG